MGAQLKEPAAQGHVRLMCSTMLRAMQTAFPIATRLRLPVQVRPDLVERGGFFTQPTGGGNGVVGMPGPNRADVLRRYPAFDASMVPEEVAPTNLVEEDAEAEQRAVRVAQSLRREAQASSKGKSGEEVVVVVAHADFIGLLARALLGLSPADLEARPAYLDLNNTGTSHIVLTVTSGKGKDVESGHSACARLLHWNRSDHLNEPLRSGITWKSVSGQDYAARWARHGEGGSGMMPAYVESDVLAVVGAQSSTSSASRCLHGSMSATEAARIGIVALFSAALGALGAVGLTGQLGGPALLSG